jgi:hypothetical protein
MKKLILGLFISLTTIVSAGDYICESSYQQNVKTGVMTYDTTKYAIAVVEEGNRVFVITDEHTVIPFTYDRYRAESKAKIYKSIGGALFAVYDNYKGGVLAIGSVTAHKFIKCKTSKTKKGKK